MATPPGLVPGSPTPLGLVWSVPLSLGNNCHHHSGREGPSETHVEGSYKTTLGPWPRPHPRRSPDPEPEFVEEGREVRSEEELQEGGQWVQSVQGEDTSSPVLSRVRVGEYVRGTRCGGSRSQMGDVTRHLTGDVPWDLPVTMSRGPSRPHPPPGVRPVHTLHEGAVPSTPPRGGHRAWKRHRRKNWTKSNRESRYVWNTKLGSSRNSYRSRLYAWEASPPANLNGASSLSKTKYRRSTPVPSAHPRAPGPPEPEGPGGADGRPGGGWADGGRAAVVSGGTTRRRGSGGTA